MTVTYFLWARTPDLNILTAWEGDKKESHSRGCIIGGKVCSRQLVKIDYKPRKVKWKIVAINETPLLEVFILIHNLCKMIQNLIAHLLSWSLHEPQGILKLPHSDHGGKTHLYVEVWVSNTLAKLDLVINWLHHLEVVLESSLVDFSQFLWSSDIHCYSPPENHS